MSFGTIESSTEKMLNSEAGLDAKVEANLEEDMKIENWMLTPFQLNGDEEAVPGLSGFSANDALLESELVIESWMTVPFKTD